MICCPELLLAIITYSDLKVKIPQKNIVFSKNINPLGPPSVMPTLYVIFYLISKSIVVTWLMSESNMKYSNNLTNISENDFFVEESHLKIFKISLIYMQNYISVLISEKLSKILSINLFSILF